jgi:hypothetical protein
MALLKKSVEGSGRKGAAKDRSAANDDQREEKPHRAKRASRKRRAA